MIRVLVLLMLSGITVSRGENGLPLAVNVTSQDFNQTLDYYENYCSFPIKKFDSNCVLKSCPNLLGKCPYSTSTGCADISSALNQCLQQQPVICGLNVGRLPLCPKATDVPLIPLRPIFSKCVRKDSFIYGLNNATFCVTGSGQKKNKMEVTISASNITSDEFNVCSLRNPIPSWNLTTITARTQLIMSLTATATITHLSAQTPTVKIKFDDFSVTVSITYPQLEKFFTEGILIPEIEKMIGIHAFHFSEVKQHANFLANYAAAALQGYNGSCAGVGEGQ